MKIKRIAINICEACLDGSRLGSECHTPGCALFLHSVDLPIDPALYEVLESFDSMGYVPEGRVIDRLQHGEPEGWPDAAMMQAAWERQDAQEQPSEHPILLRLPLPDGSWIKADLVPELFVAYLAAVRARYYAEIDSERGEGTYDEVFEREFQAGARDPGEFLRDWMQNSFTLPSATSITVADNGGPRQ